MTRETKIGLLVGLAFIIVIGILLSDHINSATDPVRADTTSALGNVEQSVGAPDSRQPAGKDYVIAPQRVVPQNPVPTAPETQARQTPVTGGQTPIEVPPGRDPSSVQLPSRVVGPVNPQPDPTIVQSPVNTGSDNPPVASNNEQSNVAAPPAAIPRELSNAARDRNEELVVPGGPSVGISPGPTIKPEPAPQVASAVRQVKAEEGDTVSKLAAKYMGANTKANRQAIINANPSVGPDGSKVFAGRTYQIPSADTSATAKVATPAPQPAPASVDPPPVVIKNPPAEATPPGVTWYTVKENDNLWKIAAEQLGSGTRWTEIKELNGLKTDDVRVNMRLKLPPKTVASNN
jgi:nucleoid-associated protein YgaU